MDKIEALKNALLNDAFLFWVDDKTTGPRQVFGTLMPHLIDVEEPTDPVAENEIRYFNWPHHRWETINITQFVYIC